MKAMKSFVFITIIGALAIFVGVSNCFVLANDANGTESTVIAPALERFRDGIPNFLSRVKRGEQVKIAYLGGSITAADGWRVQTLKGFNEKYAPSSFSEINAAIGGTGSDLGVYRVGFDVLRHDPDLVFVEFCVNDGGTSKESIWRQMEGIVRQVWRHDLKTDIVFVYTYRVGHEKSYLSNETVNSVTAMEGVADFYGIPSLDFNVPVVELAQSGRLVYQSDTPVEGKILFSTDGVHPLKEGHEIYSKVVLEAFDKMREENATTPFSLPEERVKKLTSVFVSDNYESAKLVPIKETQLSGDWTRLSDDSSLSWIKSRLGEEVFVSDVPGSTLTIRFKGSQLSIYDILGPNGGQVQITVDGQTMERKIPRFDSYCTYWRLATLLVAKGLNPEVEHEVVIKLDEEEPSRQPVAFRFDDPESELQKPQYHGRNVWFGPIMIIGEVLD